PSRIFALSFKDMEAGAHPLRQGLLQCNEPILPGDPVIESALIKEGGWVSAGVVFRLRGCRLVRPVESRRDGIAPLGHAFWPRTLRRGFRLKWRAQDPPAGRCEEGDQGDGDDGHERAPGTTVPKPGLRRWPGRRISGRDTFGIDWSSTAFAEPG